MAPQMQLDRPTGVNCVQRFSAKVNVPVRDPYESNTPKEEDIRVLNRDKGSRVFLEQVTWFVSS